MFDYYDNGSVGRQESRAGVQLNVGDKRNCVKAKVIKYMMR